MNRYTVEIEVSYHGDNSSKYFRIRGNSTSEEEFYAYILGNLFVIGIPLFDEHKEPIHGVKVSYAAPTEWDEKYLPLYGKATVEFEIN